MITTSFWTKKKKSDGLFEREFYLCHTRITLKQMGNLIHPEHHSIVTVAGVSMGTQGDCAACCCDDLITRIHDTGTIWHYRYTQIEGFLRRSSAVQ